MQGFNMGRYVPPDLEGTVSFNAASGKGHALGSRARKLRTEGALTVRFELPFPVWCTTCKPEAIIGQGVRFNAEKRKVGSYYSTPVWGFRFKHTACGGWIEIRTDPKETRYVVVEGGRRRDLGEGRLAEGEIRIGSTEEDKERMEREGAFGALERKVEDSNAARSERERIEELFKRSEKDWEDPYEKSRKLRRTFRADRKVRKEGEEKTEALKEKMSLGIDLMDENEEDKLRAGLIDYGADDSEPTIRGSMFEPRPSNSVLLAPQTDRGKRGKKLSVEDVAMEKRARLSKQLNGRTRDAKDPFLDSPSLWTPGLKRKKHSEVSASVEKSQNPNTHAASPERSAQGPNLALVDYDSD
ncbi:MAG: hypothetical protein Q9227_001995 [Pyrenula ochraceoflavens]